MRGLGKQGSCGMIVLGAAQDRFDFETSLDTTALIWGSCHSRSRTLRAQQNSKGSGRYRPLVAMGSTWGPLGFSNQEQLDAKALATWPCGLMDKALVFGTKDCRFESCQGHFCAWYVLMTSIKSMAFQCRHLWDSNPRGKTLRLSGPTH